MNLNREFDEGDFFLSFCVWFLTLAVIMRLNDVGMSRNPLDLHK